MRNISKLMAYFANNTFLKDKQQKLDKSAVQYLFRHLFFLDIEKNENVFNYGDEGDLFYIIIEGEVSIKTPFPDVLEEE